jgi:hypothetical protein
MKLIKSRAGWRRFLSDDCGMSGPWQKNNRDGEREPVEYPCYAYAVVRSFNYEELAPMIVYRKDVERMLAELIKNAP